MTTLIIRTNAARATDVLIPDMGIKIPADHTTPGTTDVETFNDSTNIQRASESSNLLTLMTDDAHGADSSTLLINFNGVDIAQADANGFLDTLSGRSDSATFDPIPKFDRGYGLFQSNASFIGVNSTSYAEVTEFPFDGTDNMAQDPSVVEIIMSAGSDLSNVSLRIDDLTNATVIVDQSVLANVIPANFNLTTIVNLPTGPAVFSISIKKNTNADGAARLSFVSMK